MSQYNNNAGDLSNRYELKIKRQDVGKLSRNMRAVAMFDIIWGIISIIGGQFILGIFAVIAGNKLKSASEKLNMRLYGAPDYMAYDVGECVMDYYRKYCIGIIANVIFAVAYYLFTFVLSGALASIFDAMA